MLYYEDLSIRGEETKRSLDPGCDLIYKGFDFHNCFYYLCVKLMADNSYPLREYDMFTLWDLIRSRLMINVLDEDRYGFESTTFFYRKKFEIRANMVLAHALSIFEKYIIDFQHKSTSTVFSYFVGVRDILEKIIFIRNNEQNVYLKIKEALNEFKGKYEKVELW